jgi:thiamine biosynthesis protein ThiI
MTVLVHYGEIALKGKNRHLFEHRLIENIEKLAGGRVERLSGRLLVEGSKVDQLENVFGVAWFAPACSVERELEVIRKGVLAEIKERVRERSSFGVRVSRADKSFPLSSQEVAAAVGQAVKDYYHLKVDLESPDLSIFIEILADRALLFFEKNRGLGGLPVGVSGRVLCLLSGGIDSAVAAFLMMKRGCKVDFLHFHTFAQNETVWKTKVKDLVGVLDAYQPESKIFLVPYYPFQLSLGQTRPGYELVLFRRFMVQVGERVAQKEGCRALVTGDSLGQVASQTLENLAVVEEASSLPIFRPLIGFDKQEIVDFARKIGTYSVSIQPYKDCCSLVSRHPKTKAKLNEVKKLEEELRAEGVVGETLRLVSQRSSSVEAGVPPGWGKNKTRTGGT